MVPGLPGPDPDAVGFVPATGNGHREVGTQVLDIFSEWKSIYVDYSGKLQRAQIDNKKAID